MSLQTLRRVAALGVALVGCASRVHAQAPTISPETTVGPGALPGSQSSTLGPLPGSGGGNFLATPGGGILGGRPGATTPRVPTAITMPGAGGDQVPAQTSPVPTVPPLTAVPLYGTLELPVREDEGPADGLTIDQAIDRTIAANLDLMARRYEIPLADADALQASLRANPLLYADTQLVPYGSYSTRRPGGPTQYDLNISYPIDYSHKRRERIASARAAQRIVEAMFQDAVRLQIANVGNAYINALAARETLRYTETGLRGLESLLAATQKLIPGGDRTRADVLRIKAQRDTAEVGVLDAREGYVKAKRILGGFLAMDPAESEALELRGSIRDPGPPAPAPEELTEMALRYRPDVIANRLGVPYAMAQYKLQRANAYSDAYLLYQPYTFQNNTPFHEKSAHSWALGITMPLPLYNRNQGNIRRAELNIPQTQIQLAALERQVAIEVRQAQSEYMVTRAYVEKLETGMLASSREALEGTRKLFIAGEAGDLTQLLNIQREYNNAVRMYHDTAIRHRRSVIGLNTAVGTRVLP
jgi:cobalt-zinc-cadmium efflux system outer membrane protein